MAIIDKKITIDKVDMLQFLGMQDANLKAIEERFEATIVARGDKIMISGEEDEVLLIEQILKEMAYVLNTSGQLRESDVELVLDLTLQGKEIIDTEEYDSIVLYTRDEAIKAKTPAQQNYLQIALQNDICFSIGPAGTGKTYLAVALAVSALKKGIVRKIVLARPAVEAGESLGFLPGDFQEKIDPYLRPLYDALDDMMPSEKLRSHIEKRVVEIVPLAYMRGRTLNNAYVILDEAQNTTDIQMKMFLTRLGANSKAIITGDITQIDLPPRTVSGLVKAQEILRHIKGIGFVYFDKGDVVRHRLVKDIIDAYDKHGDDELK